MKTITRNEYIYLNSVKNGRSMSGLTLQITDEEYDDLIQYRIGHGEHEIEPTPESEPGHDYSQDYLTFEALEDGTFGFEGNDLFYSTNNGETWKSLASGTQTELIMQGTKVLWKRDLELNGIPSLNGVGTFNSTCNFNVMGNVKSLTNFDYINETTDASFVGLFCDCTKLISAKFLILPSELHAFIFNEMFKNCINLIYAPELNNMECCGYNPCLHYSDMFYGCASLRYIKCLHIPDTLNTPQGWVYGVPPGGTFIKNKDAVWKIGEDGIPAGWEIIDYEEATSEPTPEPEPEPEPTPEAEPQEETYDYGEYDFGVGPWGYKIISLEDKTVSIKFCGNKSTLTDVIIPETVEYNNVTFSVKNISYGCFACYDYYSGSRCSMTSVTIPNSVTSIGENAFYYCTRLTSVAIPNSVTSIGEDAFYNCRGLTSITIPNSVVFIAPEAFCGCTGLTSITIPNSVKSIGNNAFFACGGLVSIEVESGNTKYDSRNNCNAIIETATNTLILGCKNTVIPDSITSIGDYAFYDCTIMTSVTIPNSVTSIGNQAFYGCTELTSVTIYNDMLSYIKSISDDNSQPITFYVLPELVDDVKTIYEKEIFLGKLNVLPIE